MFHYTIETAQSVDEAIAGLEHNLKEEQFGVLWRFDLQDKLKEKGLDHTGKYMILEVCNPIEAHRVLSEDRLYGYFLPCKIAVYEHEGRTAIGMPRPTVLIGRAGDSNAMAALAADIEERLISCIDKCK